MKTSANSVSIFLQMIKSSTDIPYDHISPLTDIIFKSTQKTWFDITKLKLSIWLDIKSLVIAVFYKYIVIVHRHILKLARRGTCITIIESAKYFLKRTLNSKMTFFYLRIRVIYLLSSRWHKNAHLNNFFKMHVNSVWFYLDWFFRS